MTRLSKLMAQTQGRNRLTAGEWAINANASSNCIPKRAIFIYEWGIRMRKGEKGHHTLLSAVDSTIKANVRVAANEPNGFACSYRIYIA